LYGAATRKHAVKVAERLGIYRPARETFHRLFDRPALARRREQAAFLRPFVRPGALAFDVGAHLGTVTSVLLDLGAHVVAVEPNPELAALVRRRYRVVVEDVALGAEQGRAQLRLGRNDLHSTTSDEWAARWPERFEGSREVAVTTLDELIARHGMPGFVKIDAEGSDAEVLAGLSHRVAAVAFEFQAATPEAARRCFERLERLGPYRYNLSIRDRFELASEWLDAEATLTRVEAVAAEYGYGNVFARAVA
jgi:FkbM family methyltransferase